MAEQKIRIRLKAYDHQVVDESSRSNMAQALDDVLMLVFSKRDFVRLLESQPKLALNYIRTHTR